VTGGHSVVQSSYQSTSEMCGVCHSLFNPIQRAHAPDGTELPFNYYEQRTYEEWRDSVFPSRNRGCIECHMKRVDGFACRERVNRYPDLAHHGIVGANTFAPRAVALLNARLSNPDPLLMLDAELAALESWVDESLASAASLAITSTHARPARAPAGGSVGIDVRLTNLTGHKLPTGYPEGRRVYLEVALHLQGRDPIVVSGEWDPATGDLIDDPQIRTYETSHGQLNVGRSQHLALANQVLSDTRLPPEGFRPNARDMEPAGRDYGQPPYRHWDEVHFEVPIPADVAPTTTGTIAVRALHQTTTGQYVRFLVFSVGTQHQAARDLAYAFDALGRSPPKQMVVRRLPIVVTEPEAPDAGVADAGAVVPQPEEGCSCRSTTSRGSTALVLSLLLLVSRRARRRRG
jgi:hypothetical protein